MCDVSRGVLFWITGLSGSGKTTIGTELYNTIREKKNNIVLLDGDILKNLTGDSISYSKEARLKRAWFYAKLCKTLTDQGIIVVCCTISMFDIIRKWNRHNNNSYVEVFLDVPYGVLKSRDQKGMYSRYEKGELSDLVGVDLLLEFPKEPDIIINNDDNNNIKNSIKEILDYLPDTFNRKHDC